MKETEKVKKDYGGLPKSLYLSLVGPRAFNIENH